MKLHRQWSLTATISALFASLLITGCVASCYDCDDGYLDVPETDVVEVHHYRRAPRVNFYRYRPHDVRVYHNVRKHANHPHRVDHIVSRQER